MAEDMHGMDAAEFHFAEEVARLRQNVLDAADRVRRDAAEVIEILSRGDDRIPTLNPIGVTQANGPLLDSKVAALFVAYDALVTLRRLRGKAAPDSGPDKELKADETAKSASVTELEVNCPTCAAKPGVPCAKPHKRRGWQAGRLARTVDAMVQLGTPLDVARAKILNQ